MALSYHILLLTNNKAKEATFRELGSYSHPPESYRKYGSDVMQNTPE